VKQPTVYIMASHRNGTIYTGVTSNLIQRAWQHKQGLGGDFTKKYGCKLLVWYEAFENMPEAITREKRIKGGSRKRKLDLIEKHNPQWLDLYEQFGSSANPWVASSPAAPRNDGKNVS
jgi:putative endonuclease